MTQYMGVNRTQLRNLNIKGIRGGDNMKRYPTNDRFSLFQVVGNGVDRAVERFAERTGICQSVRGRRYGRIHLRFWWHIFLHPAERTPRLCDRLEASRLSVFLRQIGFKLPAVVKKTWGFDYYRLSVFLHDKNLVVDEIARLIDVQPDSAKIVSIYFAFAQCFLSKCVFLHCLFLLN